MTEGGGQLAMTERCGVGMTEGRGGARMTEDVVPRAAQLAGWLTPRHLFIRPFDCKTTHQLICQLLQIEKPTLLKTDIFGYNSANVLSL